MMIIASRFNERDLLALSILRSHGATEDESLRVVNAQVDIREAAKLNTRKRITFLPAQTRPAHTPRHQYRVIGSTSIARQTGRGMAPNRHMAGAELVIRAA